MLKKFSIIFTVFLTSCLPSPLYKDKNLIENLSLIDLSKPNNEYELKLNQELVKILHTNNVRKKNYMLNVDISYEYVDNIFLANSDVIEQKIVATISYKLIDNLKGKILLENTFNISDASNNSLPLYTAYTETKKIQDNLINSSANKIYQDLIFFWSGYK